MGITREKIVRLLLPHQSSHCPFLLSQNRIGVLYFHDISATRSLVQRIGTYLRFLDFMGSDGHTIVTNCS